MAREVYKAKSLSDKHTDCDIYNGYFISSFISFESAIRLAMEQYPLAHDGKKPIGYRVTNQGIEYLFES